MAKDYYCKECGTFVLRLERGAFKSGCKITCPRCERELYGNCGTDTSGSRSVEDLMNVFGMTGGKL